MNTYERKIRKLKRSIKNFVVENSSLCDEAARIQEAIAVSNVERDFLLKKLMEYEPQSFDFIQQSSSNDSITKYKKRKNSDTTSTTVNSEGVPVVKKQPSQLNPRPPVFLEEGVTILNYGKIITDRAAYHTDSTGSGSFTIYPAGFKISKKFNGSNYICRVLDNGSFPLFEIYKENDPTVKFSGTSTDDVHGELLQAFETTNLITPDGDRFFALKNKSVIEYLSNLPNFKRLSKIIRLKREEVAKASTAFMSDHM